MKTAAESGAQHNPRLTASYEAIPSIIHMKSATTGWPRRNQAGKRFKLTVSPLRGRVLRKNEKTGEVTSHHAPFADWEHRRVTDRIETCVSGYEAKLRRIGTGNHASIGCPPHVLALLTEES